MDEKASVSHTFLAVMYRALRSHKPTYILGPIVAILLFVNTAIDIEASKRFVLAISILGTSLFDSDKEAIPKIYAAFFTAISFLLLHYCFSQILDYVENLFSLIVYKLFLREAVYSVTRYQYNFFHSQGSSVIQENTIRSSKAARDSIPVLLFEVPKSLMFIVLASREIFLILHASYAIKFLIIFFFAFVVSFFIAFYAYKKDKLNVQLFNKSLLPLSDILSNFDVMKAYNKENHEIEAYEKGLSSFGNSVSNYYFKKNILLLIQKPTFFLPQLFMIWSCLNHSKEEIFHSQALKEGISSRVRFLETLGTYNSLYVKIKNHVMKLRTNIFTLVKKSAEVKTDLKFARPKQSHKFYKPTFDKAVILSNVDFYAGNNLILKNQSFIIKKGEKVAITGMNGAGKSVFTKTLLKFFKNEGSIYIDDVSIENISDRNMRDLISYVPQDPQIFNNTVLYNISYSNPNILPEEIYKICENYGLHEFFKGLKDGYQTYAGEKGKYLSGGQKQRISFARAIVKGSPIMIMDEPTANVDRASEMEMISKIFELNPEKTLLLIVHNDEILKKFDKILYFTKQGITTYDSYEDFLKFKSPQS